MNCFIRLRRRFLPLLTASISLGSLALPIAALANTLAAVPWNYSTTSQPFQIPTTMASATNLDAKGVFRRTMPSVVLIVNPNGGLGSGVVLDRSGLIVTNDHVVRGRGSGPKTPISRQVLIGFADGKTELRATVLRSNYAYDVALLKLDGPLPEHIPPAPVCYRNAVHPGERIFLLGSPAGYAFSISQGTVSGLPKDWTLNMLRLSEFVQVPPARLVQVDGFVNGGNSGGPVINQRGEVIAIVSYGSTAEDRLNYTIPIASALSALKVSVTPAVGTATACGNPS